MAMPSNALIAQVALVGFGATALMDGWLWLLSRLGVPGTGFAMVGRWVGHFARGRFAHAAISKAAPIPFERGLGWLVHYLIGMAFAAALVGLLGAAWLDEPTVMPALVFGALTVTAPWFVMQPAMGAGFLALRTPTPLRNSLRNLANHVVFGAGLYLTAAALAQAAA
ncbi:DUF2938 domain-containing protein [Quisquiliibacterium transsilvanicum]